MNRKIDSTATIALIGTVFFWGLVPLFLKYFTDYVDGWTTNAIRYPFSALLYLPWLWIAYRRGKLTKQTWKLAFLPVFFNLIGQTLWAWTPYFIDPGLMSFLSRLSVLWAVLISFLLFKDERTLTQSTHFWLGLSLVVIGFGGMILGDNYTFKGTTATGIGMIFLCSLFVAGYQVFVRRNLRNVDSLTAFGMVSSLTSIGLIGAALSLGRPVQAFQLPLTVFLLILISGFFGIALSHFLLYFAIKRLGVAICSSTNLTGAFVAALGSRLIFRETLTQLQWLAGILLITGSMMLIRSQKDMK
ncbi:DMT family transporter [bacterium]|nr:DMT family transporter [bacterium]